MRLVGVCGPPTDLSFRHTRQVNARKKRIGHLFQGCYKALLVDAERYLLALVRYVHLNPLRAGLVADPADWPWSGHRAYLGEGNRSEFHLGADDSRVLAGNDFLDRVLARAERRTRSPAAPARLGVGQSASIV